VGASTLRQAGTAGPMGCAALRCACLGRQATRIRDVARGPAPRRRSSTGGEMCGPICMALLSGGNSFQTTSRFDRQATAGMYARTSAGPSARHHQDPREEPAVPPEPASMRSSVHSSRARRGRPRDREPEVEPRPPRNTSPPGSWRAAGGSTATRTSAGCEESHRDADLVRAPGVGSAARCSSSSPARAELTTSVQ
jgi:hypothetical protein